MKRNKSSREFWMVLALVNVLALIYPINLLLRAKSVDENLFATFVLIWNPQLSVVLLDRSLERIKAFRGQPSSHTANTPHMSEPPRSLARI